MHIRKMEEKDTEQVLALMIPFYASEAVFEKAPEAVLRRDIADCVGACPLIEGFVMEEENHIIGYSMVAQSYSTEFGGLCIWIEDLYLDEEHRNIGYGSRMLSYIEQNYQGKAVRLRLEVEPENVRAVATYRKAGFQKLGYDQMTKEFQS